jgi:hypothetical protein
LISTQVRVELRYHPSYSGQYATARRHVKDEFAAVIVHRTRKRVIPLGASVEKWSSHCGGGGGNSWGSTTLKTIAKDLEDLGVEKPLVLPLKGVPRLRGLAADAIFKLVEPCADAAAKVEKVAAVERVFEAQHKSLYESLFDGDGERRGLAEVLEKCREVLREVQQAYSEREGGDMTKATAALVAQCEAQRRAHVAALVEAARADVEALAKLSSDNVLKLLVKKSKELCPGVETKWIAIAEALVHFVPSMAQERKNQQRLDRYVREHYLSLQSNQTSLTDDEKRMICAFQSELGNKWTEIARRLGNGRADNQVKNYFYSTGQDRPWVECRLCQQWRLLPKNTEVDEDAPWTCADGQRNCTEPGDDVLPEVVEDRTDPEAVVDDGDGEHADGARQRRRFAAAAARCSRSDRAAGARAEG